MQSLLQRLHENDEAAFEEMYHLHHQKVYNFIFRYVKDSSQTKELTQELFVKLWEKRHKLSLQKPLEAQIFVMARNLVIDQLRKVARGNRLIENFSTRHNSISKITEEAILYGDLQGQLNAAVEALPERRKEIFKLSRVEGFTYPEIAEQLSISPKAVEKQMSKALKVLQAKLSSFLHIFL